MIGIIKDLEKRFNLQMQENGNKPLEINKELDRGLDELLTIVFETEVESKQRIIFEEFESRVLKKTTSYIRWNVLKAVGKGS